VADTSGECRHDGRCHEKNQCCKGKSACFHPSFHISGFVLSFTEMPYSFGLMEFFLGSIDIELLGN